MRTCNTCNKNLPLSSFGTYKSKDKSKILRRHKCNKCRSKYESERYHNDPEVKKRVQKTARKADLRNKYNLTEEEYFNLIKDQNNCCAICFKEFIKTPNVDHCHKNGNIRGLLCWNCNIALGYFKDNVDILKNAIKYLKGK